MYLLIIVSLYYLFITYNENHAAKTEQTLR